MSCKACPFSKPFDRPRLVRLLHFFAQQPVCGSLHSLCRIITMFSPCIISLIIRRVAFQLFYIVRSSRLVCRRLLRLQRAHVPHGGHSRTTIPVAQYCRGRYARGRGRAARNFWRPLCQSHVLLSKSASLAADGGLWCVRGNCGALDGDSGKTLLKDRLAENYGYKRQSILVDLCQTLLGLSVDGRTCSAINPQTKIPYFHPPYERIETFDLIESPAISELLWLTRRGEAKGLDVLLSLFPLDFQVGKGNHNSSSDNGQQHQP